MTKRRWKCAKCGAALTEVKEAKGHYSLICLGNCGLVAKNPGFFSRPKGFKDVLKGPMPGLTEFAADTIGIPFLGSASPPSASSPPNGVPGKLSSVEKALLVDGAGRRCRHG